MLWRHNWFCNDVQEYPAWWSKGNTTELSPWWMKENFLYNSATDQIVRRHANSCQKVDDPMETFGSSNHEYVPTMNRAIHCGGCHLHERDKQLVSLGAMFHLTGMGHHLAGNHTNDPLLARASACGLNHFHRVSRGDTPSYDDEGFRAKSVANLLYCWGLSVRQRL